jgi:hypothetical protein
MLGKRHMGHSEPRAEKAGVDRRQFLRRAGLTTALAAAVAGGADLVGITAASAKVKSSRQRAPSDGHVSPDTCCYTCLYEPRQCNGGKSCDFGECCFFCYYYTPSGQTCETSKYLCLGHSCNTFSGCG